MNSVREAKKEIPKIKDVLILEKLLKEEQEGKNRKGITVLLEERIKFLTIDPNKSDDSNTSVKEAEVVNDLSNVEQPIDAVILHQEKDILLILEPYKEKLKEVDINDKKLKWRDTSDKVAFLNIKNTLKTLGLLRRDVDNERKNFTEPYRNVVSFVNDNCSKFTGEIKDLESTLKERKQKFENQQAKEKQELESKKAQELEEKRIKEEKAKAEQEQESLDKIKSNSFQEKFGDIIGRTKKIIENQSKPQEDNPFEVSGNQNDLFFNKEEPIPVVLTDEQLLTKKMSLLQEIIDLGSPDSEKFIKPCATIDGNVLKIINHIKATFH